MAIGGGEGGEEKCLSELSLVRRNIVVAEEVFGDFAEGGGGGG